MSRSIAKLHLLFSIVILSCTTASVSQATTAILSASKDNTLINSPTGELSNGQGPLFAGRTGGRGPGAQRALVAFDVAAQIPTGAIITDVELTLDIEQAGSGSGLDAYSLHRVSQDWGEGTSNGFGGNGTTSTTGDATWVHTFYETATWNNAGGDFETSVSATQQIGNFGQATWGSTARLIADVQSWLDDPSSNFGWILIGDESAFASSRRFGSRESNQGPVLTVSYIPEPQTLLLLGLAIATAVTRRIKFETTLLAN